MGTATDLPPIDPGLIHPGGLHNQSDFDSVKKLREEIKDTLFLHFVLQLTYAKLLSIKETIYLHT